MDYIKIHHFTKEGDLVDQKELDFSSNCFNLLLHFIYIQAEFPG